jgi:hypothetical protein
MTMLLLMMVALVVLVFLGMDWLMVDGNCDNMWLDDNWIRHFDYL